jgi:uncharacterized protein (TIGR04141 family)
MSVQSRVLTISLANEDTSESDLLDDTRDVTATSLTVGGIDAMLYTTSTPMRRPAWESFFEEAVDVRPLALRTASASAALVLRVRDRLFAITFGYGRCLLNPFALQSSFGLRVTLNAVPPDNIRSIDKKAFEGISTHTREQASKETSIADFGLDVEKDVLRAVVGRPSNETLGKRLTGMDALVANVKLELDDLPDLLAAYLDKSAETTYKETYPWVDNIREVSEKRLKKQLDEELVVLLADRDNPRAWLGVPDLIEWNDIDGFRYTGAASAPLFPDLHLRDYLNSISTSVPTIETLHRHRVHGIRASSGQPFDKWLVYRCLYAEVTLRGQTYLLSGGAWYIVDRDFLQMINNAVDTIPETNFAPLDYTEGEGEAAYNLRLAAAFPGAACIDGKMLQYGGGRSRVEFCDVLLATRQLLHVKRYAGSSSVLSHLFAQGVVSATALVRDPAFRKQVNELLPKALRLQRPQTQPNASDFEVAYIVASRSPKPLTPSTLPFFSRVTLRNAFLNLTGMGFKVTLTKAQVR